MSGSSPFVGETVAWDVGADRLVLGVVDATSPGVAEAISALLVGSIRDARAEVGGHLPGWLVREIEESYLVPEKVRTLWAPAGHRFAAMLGERIVATVHVAKRHATILTADRTHNVVPASELPGLKPHGFHQVVNVSVLHALRRHGVAARMFEEVVTSFRHLFDGEGLWVRADPPWHGWLSRLGFEHDPSFDVFLPASVEETAELPHAAFNLLHACACEGTASAERRRAMAHAKLQYLSFTRPFGSSHTTPEAARAGLASALPTPASVEDVAAAYGSASRRGARVAPRGAGYGPPPPSADRAIALGALDRIEAVEGDRVVVGAGVTWRALLAALPAQLVPPVVPGWIDATVGGALSTGGIGKGSVRRGLAIDHVHELVVVTREGRAVRCSREEERVLFEAALGGHGQFGAIALATLSLVPRRPWVVVDRAEVAPSEIATALDVEAYHAFVVHTGAGFTAIVARESEVATPRSMGSFLAPPVREVSASERTQVQAFFDPTGLARFLGAAERERGLANLAGPEGALTIHPIRHVEGRGSLLFPRVAGDVAHAVTISAPCDEAGIRRLAAEAGGRFAPRWRIA
ncbi:MAG: FAD-dependent oxidoreductase [Deltaproteobacteria bacterium]|nr:FAD-dependent oxidoreductase [Deltaproteobacteria bacterium]